MINCLCVRSLVKWNLSAWDPEVGGHFSHDQCSCSSGQRSISYQALVIWTQFPVSVCHSTSVSGFKSSVKTFLFSKHFFQSHYPDIPMCVCVCVCVRACVKFWKYVHLKNAVGTHHYYYLNAFVESKACVCKIPCRMQSACIRSSLGRW